MLNNQSFCNLRLYIILFIICNLVVSCKPTSDKKESPEKKNQQVPIEEVTTDTMLDKMIYINLYFINSNGYLSVEKREVLNINDKTLMIKQALNSLFYGPLSDLNPSVPEMFSISNIFITGTTIVIDLNKTYEDTEVGGVEGETLVIHSIVNTALDLYDDTKQVQFLINGQQADSLMGHIDIRQPFSFNKHIVRNR